MPELNIKQAGDQIKNICKLYNAREFIIKQQTAGNAYAMGNIWK